MEGVQLPISTWAKFSPQVQGSRLLFSVRVWRALLGSLFFVDSIHGTIAWEEDEYLPRIFKGTNTLIFVVGQVSENYKIDRTGRFRACLDTRAPNTRESGMDSHGFSPKDSHETWKRIRDPTYET